jgi:hypothetical protein
MKPRTTVQYLSSLLAAACLTGLYAVSSESSLLPKPPELTLESDKSIYGGQDLPRLQLTLTNRNATPLTVWFMPSSHCKATIKKQAFDGHTYKVVRASMRVFSEDALGGDSSSFSIDPGTQSSHPFESLRWDMPRFGLRTRHLLTFAEQKTTKRLWRRMVRHELEPGAAYLISMTCRITFQGQGGGSAKPLIRQIRTNTLRIALQ